MNKEGVYRGQANGWLDNLPVLSTSTTPAIIVTFVILSISVIVAIAKVTFSVIKRIMATISVIMVIVILIIIITL